jgi:N-acetylmuramic acid 6-phosphate etherase
MTCRVGRLAVPGGRFPGHVGGQDTDVFGSQHREEAGRSGDVHSAHPAVAGGIVSTTNPLAHGSIGALRRAREAGAFTALFTSNPQPPAGAHADVVVCADTGPEAIAGSTRLKAGTAQKLLLNSFSTALMVRDGRTYSNLMVRAAVQLTRALAAELARQGCG